MAWPRSHAAPGRRLSRPRTCWHTWNGGEPITTLCVLTTHCEWHSCSHESEGASCWPNAIGSEHRRWQPAEPIDDGQHASCSLAPCRPFPLERQASLMWEECHIT